MVNPGQTAATTFYRVVKTNPPTMDDFLSDRAKGKPLREGVPHALWDGLSVFATAAQARSRARRYPQMGRFLAHLALAEAAPLRVERTVPRSRGHHTLWGNPAYLLGCVVAVLPV